MRWAPAIALSTLTVFAVVVSPAAVGEDAKPAAPGAPAAAAPKASTDAEATAALEKFKEDWKATGLKGEDRTSQRDFAMARVSRVVHRTIVEALAAVARGSDETLRMIAVAYLGDQKALPGYAGGKISAVMKSNAKDDVLVMTGLQSIGSLKWLGAREDIKAALKNSSYAIKKTGIQTVGQTGDLRLLPDVLDLVGLHIGKDGAVGSEQEHGKAEETKGYSWAGAESSVDTGTAGDADQKAAEAKVKEQLAANKAAAGGSSGGTPSASGDGGGGSGVGGRGGASRTTQELIPAVLATLRKLTGEAFKGPKDVREWMKAHQKEFQERCAALDEAEKAQAAAAK